MATSPSFSVRISESAELLSVEPQALRADLAKAGIENDSTGVSLLNASTTTIDDLVGILTAGCASVVPKLKLKAAASILKGENLSKITKNTMPIVDVDSQTQTFVEVMKMNRPIEQWGDRELLKRYAKDKECVVEQELNKRAKQQHFVVLEPGKYEAGQEEIDIELTLDLLKNARKRTNPSMLPVDGKVLPIYKITELNPQDRVIELCPICGESLYKGYCEKCQLNFSGVGDVERAYVHLIADTTGFNEDSFSDRKAVFASASKGLDDLKQTWPSLVKMFDDLKLTNSLPRLRVVMNRPSVADPFFQDGKRSFGNRTF